MIVAFPQIRLVHPLYNLRNPVAYKIGGSLTCLLQYKILVYLQWYSI